MEPPLGKCTNFSGCTLAYRNEKISVITKDFRCPECGSPLESVGPRKQTPYLLYLLAGTGAVLLLALGAFFWTLTNKRLHPPEVIEPTPATTGELSLSILPASVAPTMPPPPTVASTTPPPATVAPTIPSPPTVASTTPPPPTVAPTIPRPPPADPSNVRATVLKRIDQMPNMQDAAKDKLRDAVMQAKDLNLVLTVLFETARANLNLKDLASIKNQLAQPKNKESLKDPTLVLVVLGFADTRGADVKSYDLSRDRAQSVMTALRDEFGIRNEIHPVPMGGTAIFDPRDYAKNRVVEVWSGRP